MLVIKNGRVMDPKTGLDQVCDLLVDQGKIVKMGPSLSYEGAQVIDASGKVVQELWRLQQVVLPQWS